MNEEEIPNKELPKPKRASKPKITPVPVYDDPYADDFEWNPGVGNTQTIDVSLVSDPYSEQKVEETVPFFEPAKPFYESEMSTAEPFNVEINQSPPLFQPDIIPNFVPEPFEPESTAEMTGRSFCRLKMTISSDAIITALKTPEPTNESSHRFGA